ncbi:transglycosylase SLT domain-containing protein [Pseudaminobacter sp. NGMCC 1.201702]|uniref:transglycosylase SLT domain-containing protein n=1 Tax=Pseudaminobacter sp. NGMCC 1.201702 TaxID=3391825 RepID=UPI0039EE3B9A
MPSFSRFFLAAIVLSPLALAACSTTGGNAVDSLALSFPEDPVLPEVVALVPTPSGTTEVGYAMAAEAEADTTLSVNSYAAPAPDTRFGPATVAARSPELDALIARYAEHYEVPVDLVRRVVKRESTFNPGLRNGPYWGLMQIRHDTARGMGYRGPASGLLDAETNLKYAVRYLRGAYLVANGNYDRAVGFYARGYYYDAKRRGLLDETGLGRDRRRMKRKAPAVAPEVLPVAAPANPGLPTASPMEDDFRIAPLQEPAELPAVAPTPTLAATPA